MLLEFSGKTTSKRPMHIAAMSHNRAAVSSELQNDLKASLPDFSFFLVMNSFTKVHKTLSNTDVVKPENLFVLMLR